MSNLALFNFGILKAAYYEPEIASMGEYLFPMWDVGANASGFIALTRIGAEPDQRDWGELRVPHMFQQYADADRVLSILALWENIESVYAFTYNGLHAKAMTRRNLWFVQSDYPTYVLWWVEDTHTPTWQEACERYLTLLNHGASAAAFTFRQAFDPGGKAIELDHKRIQAIKTTLSESPSE